MLMVLFPYLVSAPAFSIDFVMPASFPVIKLYMSEVVLLLSSPRITFKYKKLIKMVAASFR